MKATISLIRTKNASAKLIHFGMWVYEKLNKIKHQKCFNHSEVRYDDRTSGAIKDGIVDRDWDSYIKSLKQVEYTDVNIYLTDEQYDKGMAYLKDVEGTKYEYAMFVWHGFKVLTGKWLGKRNRDKLFCYEHAIRFINATGKYKLDPYMNPVQFRLWVDKIRKQTNSLNI